ncbi:SENP1 protease, partial [Amia calva]|nr:SENP1 protease [Amia calva]
MLNKICEWVGGGIATLRTGAGDAVEAGEGALPDGPRASKRPLHCVLEGGHDEPEDRTVKKFKMGDLVGSVKLAAEGVRNRGSSVASWIRNTVMLPASPGFPLPSPSSTPLPPPSPTTSAWMDAEIPLPPPPSFSISPERWNQLTTLQAKMPGSLDETFIAPSGTLRWKTSYKSESVSSETPAGVLQGCRRLVCPVPPPCDTHKTNGHSVNMPPPCSTKPTPPSPRLGRSLYLRARRTPGLSPSCTAGGSVSRPQPYTSMYEKTFPIRVVSSPSRCSSPRSRQPLRRCTAQESVREEEKEVYRQLLSMVCGGFSPSSRDSGSCTSLRSHRDLTSFLSSSHRLLQRARSVEVETSDGPSSPSSPPSPRPTSSGGSSALPSPGAGSSGAENQVWPFNNHWGQGRALTLSQPSPTPPAALLDSSSQDTQSSAHDSDSVIFIKEQQAKPTDSSSVPYFKAELWIKELTSMYDSRARERRRLIEEQEALTAQLQKQRLTAEDRPSGDVVDLQLRVPLEKEVPLAPVVEEIKQVREEPEFPELTQSMEEEVNRALRGGSHDEVLSEGFRLTITRKDLQTLSHLNWLNDEVINFYMNLLVERSRRPGLPSVHTFNTFFYPKLRSAGFNAVRRWTKKVDVFSTNILLVPVHLGVHWCLAVVDFRKKSITYFDSMGGSNDEACKILLHYLQQESQDKRGKNLDTSDWVLQSKRRNEIPQQMNGSDCGMFTCKYADYITKDKPITFTQKHMPYFRRRMVWEILNRKLL